MRWSRRAAVMATITVLVAGPAGPVGPPASSGAGAGTGHGHGHGRPAPEGVWLAGDTHVHTDHSADGSLPRQVGGQGQPGNLSVADQIGQAERTGLDFVMLTDHRTYDQHWDPRWTSSQLLVVPGEEANGSPHATVHGAVDQVVDGANPPGSAAHRHVQQSIWDAHAQDASWGTAHPDDGELNADGSPNANASAVGVDTVEVWNRASDPETEIDYAEDRWNHGFRPGVVGASDSHFRELWSIAGPGQPTTWVFAAERSERAVLDALRAGRTAVSGSPTGVLATLEADLGGDGTFDAIGGDEVLARAGREGTLRVRVRRGAGTRVLLYAAPGRSAGPLATFAPTAADQTFTLPVVAGPAWYRVEVRGPGPLSGIDVRNPDPNDQLLAITSPVFVDTDGGRAAAAVPRPELPLPEPLGLDDAARPVVGRSGAFAGFPDVARASGTTHVVAEVHDRGRTSVAYSRVDGHGHRSAGRPLDLAPGSDAARFPRLAAAGRDVWVTWQDERGGQQPRRSDVYLRHSPDGGRTWGPERRLSSGAGRAEHPAIVVVDGHRSRHRRHPVVAWAESTGGAFDVLVLELGVDATPVDVAAPGKVIDPGIPTDARSPRFPASLFPAVATGPGGRIAVAWTDDRSDPDPLWTGRTGVGRGTDPDDWEVLVSTRGRGPWSAPVDVSANPAGADRNPTLAFDRDGALVAVWDTRPLQSSGVNTSLAWARSADGGTTFTPSAPLAADPAAMSQRPRLATGPDGGIRVAWYDSRSADWRWSVWTASLTRSGWTPARRLSGDGNATGPALAGDTVVFASDRGAHPQRDPTQRVFVMPADGRGGS